MGTLIQLKSLGERRCVSLGRKLVVTGGYRPGDSRNAPYLHQTEIFDPDEGEGEWTEGPDVYPGRIHFAMAAVTESRALVVGGQLGPFLTHRKFVQMLDLEDGSLETKAEASFAV